jgi:hypothetical protein
MDDVPAEKRVRLQDLEDHHCRWPCGDPERQRFRLLRLPYCSHHGTGRKSASHQVRAPANDEGRMTALMMTFALIGMGTCASLQSWRSALLLARLKSGSQISKIGANEANQNQRLQMPGRAVDPNLNRPDGE